MKRAASVVESCRTDVETLDPNNLGSRGTIPSRDLARCARVASKRAMPDACPAAHLHIRARQEAELPHAGAVPRGAWLMTGPDHRSGPATGAASDPVAPAALDRAIAVFCRRVPLHLPPNALRPSGSRR